MLDDFLTSCALTLVAAGVVLVGAEMFDAATSAPEAAVATIELETVVVIGRRDTPPPADVFVAAAGY
jgi:hypothetical protein